MDALQQTEPPKLLLRLPTFIRMGNLQFRQRPKRYRYSVAGICHHSNGDVTAEDSETDPGRS